MRVSSISLLLATVGAAVLQVAARPITVYVLSSDRSERTADASIVHLRWGLAAANANVNAVPLMPTPVRMMDAHHPQVHSTNGRKPNKMRKFRCRMRSKAISASNWLREKFGLPKIATPYHHGHHHIAHSQTSTEGGVHFLPFPTPPNGNFGVVPVAHPAHHWHPVTFGGRIHKALTTLGPWEGRAVAFVLGCGIGSLLRMLYVLAILTFRSFGSQRDEVAEIDILFEEVEEVPPPQYADEKALPVEEKVSA